MPDEPTTTPTDPTPDPDGLGPQGKKAIADERAARKAAEQQLKTIQEQLAAATERSNILEAANTTLTGDVEARQLEITRLNVGLAKGLTPGLIERLRGTDEASFTADADQLLALLPAASTSTAPRPDPSQGVRASVPVDPATEFAALFKRT